MIISLSVLLRNRNVSDKGVEKIKIQIGFDDVFSITVSFFR
jgi:hypothetical protein